MNKLLYYFDLLKRIKPVIFPAAIIGSAWVLVNPMGVYVFDVLQSGAVFAMLLFFLLSGWLLHRKRYRSGLASLGAFMLLLGFLKPWLLPSPVTLTARKTKPGCRGTCRAITSSNTSNTQKNDAS